MNNMEQISHEISEMQRLLNDTERSIEGGRGAVEDALRVVIPMCQAQIHIMQMIANQMQISHRSDLSAVAKVMTGQEPEDMSTASGLVSLAVYDRTVEELTEAIRFTVEYVGTSMLPAGEGWAWYAALQKYAPEKAVELTKSKYMYRTHGDRDDIG